MKIRYRLATTILKPINPSVIIILGVYTVVWGLWLVNPFWTVFTQAALYSAMAAIAGEAVWGTIAIIAGAFIVRGALKPSYKNLQFGALVGFLHWLMIGMLYLVGDVFNTGGITSLTFAIYAGIIWLNVRINKSHFDD